MRKAARKDLELKLGDAKAAANMLQRRLGEATHKAAQEAASQAAQLAEHTPGHPSPSPSPSPNQAAQLGEHKAALAWAMGELVHEAQARP